MTHTKVNALRECSEWKGIAPVFGRMLLPSILDKAFKGEL